MRILAMEGLVIEKMQGYGRGRGRPEDLILLTPKAAALLVNRGIFSGHAVCTSDKIEDLFQSACLAGDLDSAEDLLTVLVNMQERRSRKFGGERRISDDAVVRARAELARRRAVRLPRAA